jgi:hypothetical protein
MVVFAVVTHDLIGIAPMGTILTGPGHPMTWAGSRIFMQHCPTVESQRAGLPTPAALNSTDRHFLTQDITTKGGRIRAMRWKGRPLP